MEIQTLNLPKGHCPSTSHTPRNQVGEVFVNIKVSKSIKNIYEQNGRTNRKRVNGNRHKNVEDRGGRCEDTRREAAK
uniref:Uncharacterized protein n=1 Tax=Solanum tuberosum TaxID=4113 RepID=M1AWN2_SOLTU